MSRGRHKQGRRDRAFEAFRLKVEAAGLEAVRHMDWHWQICGGAFTVNYYPTTTTIYINRTHSSRGHQLRGTWDDAIRAATEVPEKLPSQLRAERMNTGRSARRRRKLLARDPHCHWCGRHVEEEPASDYEKATLDHVIPLHRGGSNGPDNTVLACGPCNERRANKMPEIDDPAFQEYCDRTRQRREGTDGQA